MDCAWTSRRSPVYARNGIAASSQPLASEIGIRILQKGGNAADAAVAMAAALNVTQPCSTGIGGDAFVLYWDAKQRRVRGLNGSGRAPQGLSLARLNAEGFGCGEGLRELPPFHVHTIIVPGAAAAWCDTVSRFGSGRLTLPEILAPAIELAEGGFPVAPVTADWWASSRSKLLEHPNGRDMLMPNGEPPKAGDIMRMPNLARTFRELAQKGAAGFYSGRVGKAIVELVQSLKGTMTEEDLQLHLQLGSEAVEPLFAEYRGTRVWELPPNGQGIVALEALRILEGFDLSGLKWKSTKRLHLLLEALRLSFADARQFVADPARVHVPMTELLSEEYIASRRLLLNPASAARNIVHGHPSKRDRSGTVYFCVVDKEGNACSFINSNYMGFGTGYIPTGCGFTLQNRGHNFSLKPGHPNVVEPGKRPYHTIIPGMMTRGDELYCVFGNMGGFMQPQGHVQLASALLDLHLDPQSALELPRFCIEDGTANGQVAFEVGISESIISELARIGHNVCPTPLRGHQRSLFGNGQIITRDSQTGVLCAGSDPRCDGCAIGY